MADPKEIEALANESGNNFHCRVINAVEALEWEVLVSPYYMDAATDKPREIDLITERYWKYQDRFERKYGAIVFRLFVECKYIAQPTVFWFAQKDITAATKWLTTYSPLRKDNMFTAQHHYLAASPIVAKLFASKNKANTENEAMYKALNQSLNALVYLRGKEPLDENLKNGRIPILAEVEMPVIVCSSFSDFYAVDMDSPGSPIPITENFQLEVNYAYIDTKGARRSEYFLIDVVEFDQLQQYFETLAEDKSTIARIL